MPKKVSKLKEAKKEPHQLAKDLLNGLIGVIVFLEIMVIFSSVATLVYINITNPAYFPDLRLLYSLFSLFALFGGFYFGYKSRKNQNLFYQLFNPRKQTILLSLVVSLIWLAFALCVGGDVLYLGKFLNLAEIPLTLLIVLWLGQAIGFFPISSVAGYVYENRPKLKEAKIPLLLIILLNPISVAFGLITYQSFSFQAANVPCGATIANFAEISPARDAGMMVNETIIALDSQEVRYTRDISEYLSKHSPSEPISIRTDLGVHQVLPTTNSSGGTIIGVMLNQKYCPR